MADDVAAALADAIDSPWLTGAIEAARGGDLREAMRAFVAAPRHVGRDPVAALGGKRLRGPDDEIATEGWAADVAARVAVLCALAAGAPGELVDTVDSLFREGDNREKTAIVRALCLLRDGARFTDIAFEAGRTNDSNLFRALACDNPYPARHYPELEFNKLVMKAAFVGAPIDRILGVLDRANDELSRMAMEYIDEQQAATRRFPPQMFEAIGARPRPGAVARMAGYLNHSIAENRLWAARGLALTGDPRAAEFLRERLEIEADTAVRDAIAKALERTR